MHPKRKTQLIEDITCFEVTGKSNTSEPRNIAVQIDNPVPPCASVEHNGPDKFLTATHVPPMVGVMEMLGYWFRDREQTPVVPSKPGDTL